MIEAPIPWIDEEASRLLPFLCAQGEGQSLEYKRELPKNGRDLAKEVAAFATSNAGTILIGVNDDGTCLGIPADTSAQRDELLRRLEGICSQAVKPSITPIAKFATDGERIVLMLSVPKGSQPIYYANDIPYVRHLTSSRPAQPHEVIDLIRGTVWPLHRVRATESVEETPEKRTQFLADLMQELASVVIFGEELEHRTVNPWLELIRSQFATVASRLREAATDQIAVDEKLDVPLLDAAEALEQFAKLRLHLGSGKDLSMTSNAAIDRAKGLLERIEPQVYPYVSPKQLTEQLVVIRRQLAQLAIQADKAPRSGNMGELQSQATELGLKILNIAQYGVDRLAPNLRSALLAAGHQLHISETERMYLDGGVSMRQIIENIKMAIDQFNTATQAVLATES
jgi:ATP-dependent DNA helicase RecG